MRAIKYSNWIGAVIENNKNVLLIYKIVALEVKKYQINKSTLRILKPPPSVSLRF